MQYAAEGYVPVPAHDQLETILQQAGTLMARQGCGLMNLSILMYGLARVSPPLPPWRRACVYV